MLSWSKDSWICMKPPWILTGFLGPTNYKKSKLNYFGIRKISDFSQLQIQISPSFWEWKKTKTEPSLQEIQFPALTCSNSEVTRKIQNTKVGRKILKKKVFFTSHILTILQTAAWLFIAEICQYFLSNFESLFQWDTKYTSLNLVHLFFFADMAQKIFSSYAETLDRFPVALPEMTNGLMLLNQSPTQIIISGVEDDAKSKTLIEAVYGMLLPHKILLRASEKEKSNLIYQNVEMLQNIPTGSSTFLCYCHVKANLYFLHLFFFQINRGLTCARILLAQHLSRLQKSWQI